MFWLLLGCFGGGGQALEEGEWLLSGSRGHGFLQVSGPDCQLALWSDGLQTAGDSVSCTSNKESDGQVGLSFTVEMGAGSAFAYGVLSADRKRLRLPLGSRDGDFVWTLDVREGAAADADLESERASSNESLAQAQALWKDSVFRLKSGERLVGELFLPDEGAAQIQLYAPEWMTPSRVPATLAEKGPDLWMSFELMPSLDGEQGLVLLNRPTNTLVFPMSEQPTPGEIRLSLEQGDVSAEERAAAIELALAEGADREAGVGRQFLRLVHSDLVAAGCPSWEQFRSQRAEDLLQWKGYSLTAQKEGDRCSLLVEPRPIQHGRRVAFRVAHDGEIRVAPRPLSVE